MPRRADIASILVIGSGPITIGQAAEFDYSGTQALKVLREDGYRVILVNSNPATIMTDPEFADATYVEPITAEVLESILDLERPSALLPTLGGQTALNVTMELAARGSLDKLRIEVIGAKLDSIEAAEDRGRFKSTMEEIGIATARSSYVRRMEDAVAAAVELEYPVMVRPSYILGGGGTGLARNEAELRSVVEAGLAASPVGEILVEESLLGWKEFELEVMRDVAGNAVIVCSIENVDPMGVHTGDSITVAPIQTLSDREYQEMRDEAIACLRAVGVDTGGSNVQFAVDPRTGRRVIVEMNPRVSRSSALASKATGFPIAKIAAKLAVGYTLDEIVNDITGATPACFEPALDYVVVKVPRFDFSKFPSVPAVLGTSMQSVGESMAFGRTFPEALQKALRSQETGWAGLAADPRERGFAHVGDDELIAQCEVAAPERIFAIAEALLRGVAIEALADATSCDAWFIDQMSQIVELRSEIEKSAPSASLTREAKRMGYSDVQLGYLWGLTPDAVASRRAEWGIRRSYKTVDTCAAEFEAETPYFYATFEDEDEAPPPGDRTVVVLGSGPNRIGQGIEFDYCCVHASFALGDAGYETVMVNCNPETVSTDYDTSDRLYFEPLTAEDVLAVVEAERPIAVIVQLGGQTPLGLARSLVEAGIPIAGTPLDAIDTAEDRDRFSALCSSHGVPQPPHGTATTLEEAAQVVARVGLPALVRPSYVLGGRAMRIVYTADELEEYLGRLYSATSGGEVDLAEGPVLIDRFLEGAIEVDIDAIYDGVDLYVGGVMEHIEEAGVHSGDSACVVPPPTLSGSTIDSIIGYTATVADALGVRGLINMQFAVQGDDVYVLEANPRASRTVPFISKATGVPLAKAATRVMMGESVADLRAAGLLPRDNGNSHRYVGESGGFVAVKEAVLPWSRFPAQDTILGPEMRATGEVMGIGPDLGIAYGKALLGAGHIVPDRGTLFLSLADKDKEGGIAAAAMFHGLGFTILATQGTAAYMLRHGIPTRSIDKIGEGANDALSLVRDGAIDIVINTPRGRRARGDGAQIRMAANVAGVPCVTTVQGAIAVAGSLRSGPDGVRAVRSLQSHHGAVR